MLIRAVGWVRYPQWVATKIYKNEISPPVKMLGVASLVSAMQSAVWLLTISCPGFSKNPPISVWESSIHPCQIRKEDIVLLPVLFHAYVNATLPGKVKHKSEPGKP